MNNKPPETKAPDDQGLSDFHVVCDDSPRVNLINRPVFYLQHTIQLSDGYVPHTSLFGDCSYE